MNIRKFSYLQGDRLGRMGTPVTALGVLGKLKQGVYPDEQSISVNVWVFTLA